MSYFGDWLTDARERRGLGVRGLAEKAGISHATISKVEGGLVGISPDKVQKIADALEVSVSSAMEAWVKDKTSELREDPATYNPDSTTREPDTVLLNAGARIIIDLPEGGQRAGTVSQSTLRIIAELLAADAQRGS